MDNVMLLHLEANCDSPTHSNTYPIHICNYICKSRCIIFPLFVGTFVNYNHCWSLCVTFVTIVKLIAYCKHTGLVGRGIPPALMYL